MEFSLVSAIFLLLVLGVVDFARFMLIKAILQRAANYTADLAARYPNVEIDTERLVSTEGNNCNARYCNCRRDYQNEQCVKYYAALRDVLRMADDLPLLAVAGDYQSSSSVRLQAFVVPLPIDNDGNSRDEIFNAILLRPGEEYRLLNGGTRRHPNRERDPCFNGNSGCPLLREIMKREPLIAELRADVSMILPFLGTLTAVGTGTAFREIVPAGSFPEALPFSYSSSSSSRGSSAASSSAATSSSSSSSSSSSPYDGGN